MKVLVLPIAAVVLANVLYQISSKGIPLGQNAFMGLIVNYATALSASIILFCLTEHESVITEVSKTNWACILMGISITAVEAGFVMIYRLGGQLSTISLIVSILLAVAMLIVGVCFYSEVLTPQKIIGAVLCIIGIIVISI